MSTELTRRRFLVLAAAGFVASCSSGGNDAASGGVGASTGTATTSPSTESAARAGPGIRSLFDDPEAVAAVGRAAGATPGSPSRDSSMALLESLGATRDPSGVIDVDDPVELAAAVREQVRADHGADDVHVVEGWVLARTQVALALVLAG